MTLEFLCPPIQFTLPTSSAQQCLSPTSSSCPSPVPALLYKLCPHHLYLRNPSSAFISHTDLCHRTTQSTSQWRALHSHNSGQDKHSPCLHGVQADRKTDKQTITKWGDHCLFTGSGWSMGLEALCRRGPMAEQPS